MLQRLSVGAPAFDLLVVDEAHHFKNSETLSRRILGEIADAANQVLLLTATPLQTEVDDLLSLLRLLDTNAFRSREQYLDRLSVNFHIVQAERVLRAGNTAPDRLLKQRRAAAEALNRITPFNRILYGLDDGDAFDRALTKLTEEDPPTLPDTADLVRDIRSLNLLTPYVTRTRKVEVQESCERRVESVRPQSLYPAERQFYDTCVRWLRNKIAARHGVDRVLFLSRNLERRLASSLHAFARVLRSGNAPIDALLGDPPSEVLDAAKKLGKPDSKFERLHQLLEDLTKQKPGTKFLIFASYRATLRYLSRNLRERSWDHEVIHGDVAMAPDDAERDERGRRVERFLTDPACNIMLASNVGGEGLDLQAATVVINYDFPWNPATVEQRIGRIDRYGQEADVVQVLSFILPDTVEELIYTRLFDRQRLFETALGDFAQIVGFQNLSPLFLKTIPTRSSRVSVLPCQNGSAASGERRARGPRSCGSGYFRPHNVRRLLAADLPAFSEVAATVKILGQELTANGKINEQRDKQISILEERLTRLEETHRQAATTTPEPIPQVEFNAGLE